jgi:hypothetical protein
MKRYQEIRGQAHSEPSEVYNRQETSTRSPPKPGQTDPSVWQGERSVRPMQDNHTLPPGGASTPVPPPRFRPPEDQPSPYDATPHDHPDPRAENPEHSQRGEWRNSGVWGRQQGGGVGVGEPF